MISCTFSLRLKAVCLGLTRKTRDLLWFQVFLSLLTKQPHKCPYLTHCFTGHHIFFLPSHSSTLLFLLFLFLSSFSFPLSSPFSLYHLPVIYTGMFSHTVIILCFYLETDGVAGGSCQVGFIYGLGQRPCDGVEGGMGAGLT